MMISTNYVFDADNVDVESIPKAPLASAADTGVADATTTNATNMDTVSLKTLSMSASQARLLKLSMLRESIEAGQYQVLGPALAGSMMEKANAGEAPELSFLIDRTHT